MARLFNGTSDYIEANAAVLTAVPLTLACWFKTTAVDAVAKTLMSIGDAAATTRVYLYVRLNSTGLRAATVNVGSAENSASNSVTLTAGQWYHGCGVFASDTDRRVFLDGANKATDVISNILGTPTVTTIGARYAAGARGSFVNGCVAEAAIWNAALADAEVAILAAGYSPLMVRPANLRAYWPLIGRYSPEIDIVGRFDGTVTGAVVADHPRIIYKRRQLWTPPQSAGQRFFLIPS